MEDVTAVPPRARREPLVDARVQNRHIAELSSRRRGAREHLRGSAKTPAPEAFGQEIARALVGARAPLPVQGDALGRQLEEPQDETPAAGERQPLGPGQDDVGLPRSPPEPNLLPQHSGLAPNPRRRHLELDVLGDVRKELVPPERRERAYRRPLHAGEPLPGGRDRRRVDRDPGHCDPRPVSG